MDNMACMYIQIIHFHFNNKKQQNRISCPKYHTIRSYTPRFDYYDQEQISILQQRTTQIGP